MAVKNMPTDIGINSGFVFKNHYFSIPNGYDNYIGDFDTTIELIIKTSKDVVTNQSIVRNTNYTNGLRLQISKSKLIFGYFTDRVDNILTYDIKPETVYHIILQYDKATSKRKLFINSNLVSEHVGLFTDFLLYDTFMAFHQITLGGCKLDNRTDRYNEYYNGILYQFRIWKTLLSDIEIKTIFNNGQFNQDCGLADLELFPFSCYYENNKVYWNDTSVNKKQLVNTINGLNLYPNTSKIFFEDIKVIKTEIDFSLPIEEILTSINIIPEFIGQQLLLQNNQTYILYTSFDNKTILDYFLTFKNF